MSPIVVVVMATVVVMVTIVVVVEIWHTRAIVLPGIIEEKSQRSHMRAVTSVDVCV